MAKHNRVSLVADPAAEVFDEAGVCAYLKTNPRMLRKMRREFGLPFIRLSAKSLRYRRPDIQQWLGRHLVAVKA
jgi:hypothetical protein